MWIAVRPPACYFIDAPVVSALPGVSAVIVCAGMSRSGSSGSTRGGMEEAGVVRNWLCIGAPRSAVRWCEIAVNPSNAIAVVATAPLPITALMNAFRLSTQKRPLQSLQR